MRLDQVTERRGKVQVWIYWISKAVDPIGSGEFRVLLLKTIPERESFWQPVTGGIEHGETPEVAARREVFEETGLIPSEPLFSLGEPFDFESRWGPAREVAFGCQVEGSSSAPPGVRLDPREHDQFAWVFAEKALEQLRFDSNAQMLINLTKKLVRK